MVLIQKLGGGAVGPEVHPGVAEVVAQAVFIVPGGGAVGRQSSFAVVNGFCISTIVLYAVHIVLFTVYGRVGQCLLAEFRTVGGIYKLYLAAAAIGKCQQAREYIFPADDADLCADCADFHPAALINNFCLYRIGI